ncbi:MAG: VOC family protein [Candidatus Thermoplasmatota archaeon]|nr:VOC family protein [Candidatus Thermoplasmatota archaeon]
MADSVQLHHVALQCTDRTQAQLFFTKILGMTQEKTFTLSAALSQAIFDIDETVDVDVYCNATTRFEIFCTSQMPRLAYQHVCLVVSDKDRFIERCRHYGLEPFTIPKSGRTLLFIHDFSRNVYEIKEQQ